MAAPTKPDLHSLFLQLGFKDEFHREQAFQALAAATLAHQGIETRISKLSNQDVSTLQLHLACYHLINDFGKKLWPAKASAAPHLADFDPDIHPRRPGVKGRVFRYDFDGHIGRLAKKALRGKEGWLAKPDAVTDRATSRLGRKLQEYFQALLQVGFEGPVVQDENVLVDSILKPSPNKGLPQ